MLRLPWGSMFELAAVFVATFGNRSARQRNAQPTDAGLWPSRRRRLRTCLCPTLYASRPCELLCAVFVPFCAVLCRPLFCAVLSIAACGIRAYCYVPTTSLCIVISRSRDYRVYRPLPKLLLRVFRVRRRFQCRDYVLCALRNPVNYVIRPLAIVRCRSRRRQQPPLPVHLRVVA